MTPTRSTAHALLVLALLAVIPSCSFFTADEEQAYPKTDKDIRRANRGKLTGEEGLQIGGANDKDKEAGKNPLGVNSFLWRASLDTISFMPLASADPFGGTIITDWYSPPETPNERFKLNVFILDKQLRSDGVSVKVFRQNIKGGSWRDSTATDSTARQLEEAILTRARQMRIDQMKREDD